jgi:hypothetical protein
MNKDAAGTTATDAAAPANAGLTETSIPAAELSPSPLTVPDAPPSAPSDVIEISEYYETDDELAQFALERFNAANAMFEDSEDDDFLGERSGHIRAQAACAAHLLNSRALMRSAAATERLCGIHERSEARLLANRARDEEYQRLQLENLRLQHAAFTGEIERLQQVAALALVLVNTYTEGLVSPGRLSLLEVNKLVEVFCGRVRELAPNGHLGAAS